MGAEEDAVEEPAAAPEPPKKTTSEGQAIVPDQEDGSRRRIRRNASPTLYTCTKLGSTVSIYIPVTHEYRGVYVCRWCRRFGIRFSARETTKKHQIDAMRCDTIRYDAMD